ncbi:MAG: hypothetical protein WAW86_09780 [Gammaproteobacteria bacterium]
MQQNKEVINKILEMALIFGLILLVLPFFPLFIQIVLFIRHGEWSKVSINDLFAHFDKNLAIEKFSLSDWKGIEKILNWFLFDLNAAIAFFLIAIIYLLVMSLIINKVESMKK